MDPYIHHPSNSSTIISSNLSIIQKCFVDFVVEFVFCCYMVFWFHVLLLWCFHPPSDLSIAFHDYVHLVLCCRMHSFQLAFFCLDHSKCSNFYILKIIDFIQLVFYYRSKLPMCLLDRFCSCYYLCVVHLFAESILRYGLPPLSW